MESMDTDFGDLLHKAEQLTADIDGESELPRIERNLRQLLDAGEQLWSRTSTADTRQTNDVRASVLLGSKGYDLQKVSQQLDSLSASKKLTPIEAIAETDIKGFLKSERENAIIKIIEDIRKSTIEKADKLYMESLQREWEEEKHKILNALVGPEEDITDFSSSFDITSIRSQTISSTPTHRTRLYFEPTLIDTSTITSMNGTEIAFAKEVIKYVDKTIFGSIRSNLANTFLEKVAKETIGESLIIDLWEMVSTLISSDIPVAADCEPLVNRCDPKVNAFLIRQSKLFLQQKFVQSIQSIVNPTIVMSTSLSASMLYKLIKDYLIIKTPYLTNSSLNVSFGTTHISNTYEDGLVDGIPIWCFIWYCLRAGSIDAAIEVAIKGPVWIINDFISVLREYKQSEDKRLSQKSENQIKLLYKKTIRLSTDVYKKTVFAMLGSCGISEFPSEVLDKVDDYLWLRLSQIQIHDKDSDSSEHSILSNTSSPLITSDKLTFNKLKQQISEEYGEMYFNAKDQPFMYFKALFLTNQFEAAIEFLFRIDTYRSHAIHIAIALNELHLLIVPHLHLKVPIISKHANDPLSVQRLNFAKLISIYTRKFEANNAIEAIYYFYLLRNIKTTSGDNLFTTTVSKLVRETKNYDTLLGYISDDGCRITGTIAKFNNDVNAIIDKVAIDLENEGAFEDAVKLYDLNGKHNKVLQLLNKLLSPLIAERKVVDSKRTRLETLALKLAERYCSKENNASPEVAQTFYLLIDLMTFFDYYHNQQYNDALDTIIKLKILPFESSDIEMKVNQFSRYSEEVRRNIADILLATMNILYPKYKELKSSTPRTVNRFGIIGEIDNKEQLCTEIRQKARALITYAGMIPYRMPGDSNARLVQLEVLMN
ncbi:nuclear pore complex protein Nup93-like [Oppia nitens]|uniref:nuclear pore complex protein Nup93-like n=1 Tax=Oppia nitens TaxID=1686743 RepID=UPI0023D97F92|nr:nuclear pore complex protein Nup93-like [Oppia nitens]